MENNQKTRLHPIVVGLVGDSLAEQWWTTPNKAFDMKCPIEANFQDVKEYLIWHGYCAGG